MFNFFLFVYSSKYRQELKNWLLIESESSKKTAFFSLHLYFLNTFSDPMI